MTIALPIYRGISTKFAGRSFQFVTRCGYNPWLARVDQTYDGGFKQVQSQNPSSTNSVQYLLSRGYATTARARPAGRSKATSTRAPGRKSTRPAAKKSGPKTAAGKKKVGRKLKAKTTAKPRARKAKKPPSRTAINRTRLAKEKNLKEQALLDEPKRLPATPWQIIFAEAHAGAKGTTLAENQNVTKQAAQKLRSLTPEEKERYNHEAHLAKEKNEKAHEKWLSQFTPDQIREANNARTQLKKIDAAKRPNRKHRSQKYAPLKDDRLVKHPRGQYIYFVKDRFASGDFAKMTVQEASKLIAREWKAIDNKKPYADQADADLNRYIEEHQTVYGRTPNTRKSGKSR